MTVHNHQLFAHTYLDRHLQDSACDEPAAGLIQALRDWAPYWDFSSPEKVLESAVGPTLDYLGFHRVPAADDSRIQLLYPDSRRETLLGLCFTPPPGAVLDDTRKGSFWAYEAVNAARKHAARWAMLTDGVRWRLLDAEHLTPYEVYLEVDLGGLAGGELDLQVARALYGFFGRPAWGQDQEAACSLAHHQVASLKATEEAEKHLRARIETVLGNVSRGFVASDGRVTYTEEERVAIFDSATVAIYRILFALYAEARGLLPAATPAYRDQSMAALAALALTYHTSGIPDPHGRTLWEGLKRIWTWIDKGEPVLGIPEYNGGLFDDEKADHLDRDLTYLREHVVEDAYLAEALVDLTHLRIRGGGWRLLDYRDLSVRHLGSLYEGLLEYKLFVAAESLFERREGNDLLYLVASGHTKKKTDREIEPGGVYFAQNLLERKVSGTYYTPEYIVDYIVKNTVRTGLERLRARLMPRLKRWLAEIAAERDPAQRARLQRQVDSELLRFVEEQVLTFRVCDMAMGSGHFLVNATQVITNFIVEMLNRGGWENPGVDCDPAAWRRRVVERCIYGVDLNPLAVELAKLSLWLVTAAEGRPLSFLDHHLRSGNSVIGARMSDLRVGATEKRKRPSKKQPPAEVVAATAAVQLTLLDTPGFQQGMESAVAQALEIEGMQIRAASDVHAQEAAYAQLRDDLNRKYGRLADLWVARSFGIVVDDELWGNLTQYGLTNNIEIPHAAELIRQAQVIARQRRFFHWELEFPEVFFDRHGQPLKNKAGFSVTFGNPPYVRQERFADQKGFFEAAFAEVYSGIADLYIFFVAQGLRNLAADGLLGFIAANKWLRADYAAPLRSYLVEKASPTQLLDFGHSDVFPGTDTFPCILIVAKAAPEDGGRGALLFAGVSDRARGKLPLPAYVEQHAFEVPYVNLGRSGWVLESAGVSRLLDKLQTQFSRMGDYPGVDALRGIITGLNEAFYVDTPTRDHLVEEDPNCRPLLRELLRGRTVRRWRPAWDGGWMIVIPSSGNRDWPWSDCKSQDEAEQIFRDAYPTLHAHLKPFERQLRQRQDQGRFWWELRACDYYDALERPKIVVQQILYHSAFALDGQRHWVNQKVYLLPTDDWYLLALLNSRIMWWYLSRAWPHMKDEALAVQKPGLLALPVPLASSDLLSDIASLARQAHELAGRADGLAELLRVERQLNEAVTQAYELTDEEIAIIERTLPPRDPLVVLEARAQARNAEMG